MPFNRIFLVLECSVKGHIWPGSACFHTFRLGKKLMNIPGFGILVGRAYMAGSCGSFTRFSKVKSAVLECSVKGLIWPGSACFLPLVKYSLVIRNSYFVNRCQ